MADSNIEVVRRLHGAFTSGDLDMAMAQFADEAVWTSAGNSPISGEYKGKARVQELFGKLVSISEGTFVPELHDLAASDDHVVFLGRATGKRSNGKTIDTQDSVVFHVKDGQITEAWQQGFDQKAMDDFWS